jgi:phosphate transport system permease protein
MSRAPFSEESNIISVKQMGDSRCSTGYLKSFSSTWADFLADLSSRQPFEIPIAAQEEMIRLVPATLREAALALGYTRWRTSLAIVLRTAMPGIVTGALVAVARIAGETAPLLFTALGNQFWSVELDQPIAALPLQIFAYAISPYDEWHAQAWAGSLVLIALVLVISLVARRVTRARFGSLVD